MKGFKSILLVLACYLLCLVQARGKGPTGIYTINNRYIMIGDMNFGAIFIIDLHLGGLVGQLILHDRQYDPENQGWSYEDVEGGLNPIEHWIKPGGLSSCETCREIWITSLDSVNFFRIRLKRPLKEMADEHDFSDFTESVIEGYNPWGATNEEHIHDGNFRYIALTKDGSAGFFSHRVRGIFQFIQQDPNVPGVNILEAPGSKLVGAFDKLTGLTLNHEDRFLISTSEKYLYIVDLLDPTFQTVTKYNLQSRCRGTWEGKMNFADAVMVGDDIYAVGKAFESTNGMNLFWIEADKEGGWDKCVDVAGGFAKKTGWVDGVGDTVRLSRPHAMARLPGTSMVVFTDIDNRSVRVADVSKTPAHVSTVSYDEGLWHRLYVSGFVPPKKGVPHLLPEAKARKNVSGAREVCNGDDKLLCSLSELRSYLSQEQGNDFGGGNDVVTIWTGQDCHSCWLRDQGVCHPASVNDTIGDQKDFSAWGSEYQMLAFISTSSEGLPIMRTECTDSQKEIESDAMCCAPAETVTFYGRVLLNDNGSGKNDTGEEGYQGAVGVKLIRKQDISPRYRTVEVRSTYEDGTFEISLASVCAECKYYLKFELDDDANYEFVPGGDIKVRKEVGRSTPTNVTDGDRYEINAAVLPKVCRPSDGVSFHGHVWFDDNADIKIAEFERGYDGVVLIKLIRKQELPKRKFKSVEIGFTNDDGTFEIPLETVCDDSTYYLKFEMENNQYEFTSGGDTFRSIHSRERIIRRALRDQRQCSSY